MEQQEVTKYKWFWAWQDEKEEAWLHSMSRLGYHLKEPGIFGSYKFDVGIPEDFIYRLDFVTSSTKDKDSYLQLFKDSGWDYLGNMGGWQYFRIKALEGENPQIFSDHESKIQKYQRIIAALVIYYPLYMLSLTILSRYDSGLIFLLQIFFAMILILFSVAMLCLIRRISVLKKKL